MRRVDLPSALLLLLVAPLFGQQPPNPEPIPDLNYLEVRNETATNGRVRPLFNIRVGEQPAHLFVPTAGAPVRQVSSPDELWKR